jgi:hypothetical protein
MKFVEFDQYSEDLLLAQYDVSEIISHELMKGEIREDFLKAMLETCSEPSPLLVRGTVSDGNDDAGQLDIILCRQFAHVRKLGTHSLVERADALCVIEVKGNCTGRDLRRASEKAKRIRGMEGGDAPLYGIVSYKVALELRTILDRFGHTYDAAAGTYFDNATIPNEAELLWKAVDYPELDFFISLEGGKKVFLRKYEISAGKPRFIRRETEPLIQELFAMIRALWVPTIESPSHGASIA